MNWTQPFSFVQIPAHWSSCTTNQSLGTAENVTQEPEIISAASELSRIKNCHIVAMCTRISSNKCYVL